jgi:hypothetical protein
MHVASEHLWSRSLGTEAASLPVVSSASMRVPHEALGLCIFIPLLVLTTCLWLRSLA